MFAVIFLSCNTLYADERSVTVTGTGKALAKPDLLEIELQAGGEAELMADATTKYDGAVRRITGAIEKLEIKGLKIEPHGIRITNQASGGDDQEMIVFAPAGGGRQTAAKTHNRISRSLRVVVSKIDQMHEAEVIALVAKLLDAAQDAGAAVGPLRRDNAYEYIVTADGDTFQSGPGGVVTFVVSDATAAREEAYRKAFADATRRAERVARLAGARVGSVLSADETDSAQMVIYRGRGGNVTEDRLVSSALEEVPVGVLLQVRFALIPNDQQNGAKKAIEK